MSAETKRILFVDDEPNVLQGLQRMLREYRKDWNMSFALSGAAALELLGKEPFDVIVTDMRMPGMDGAELLAQVSTLHPNIVRLVLSGDCSAVIARRSMVTAHQFLAKPCDAKHLRATVVRACALRELMSDPSLVALAARMESLRSVPPVYAEVERIPSPRQSLADVARAIEKDGAVGAKVLQLVNSPMFGLHERVVSHVQTATLLGAGTLKALVLAVEVFSSFDAAAIQGISVAGVWRHSLAVGALARRIAMSEDADETLVEDAFMAGMLHDVGTLVLAASLPSGYERAPALVATARVDHTHPRVGAYLIGIWGMADEIVEAVAYHHEPLSCPDRTFSALTAVHVGNALDGSSGGPDLAYLETLGLAGRLEDWRRLIASVPEEAPA